ncbi:phage tail tape measure protein [Pasteurellaceae bacterium USgator11]|nr:phage tail tape measure protein [Pasteurellaceae bacterium USgator41]TNG98714.1 phage tail tape measure protein [Pasteurellaceae bacterium UScroc31]TNH00081.1 phage tail tape measure protein [Pasteurellaceae bacterium USgator11]
MATELAIAIKVGAVVGAAVGAFASLGKSISGLTQLTAELENEQQQLGASIEKHMGKSDLIVGDLTRKYDKLGITIDKLKAKQTSLNNALLKREKLAAERDQLKGKIIGTAAIAMTAAAPVKLAIDFESAMADVKKVVDFDTPQQFKEMERDILNLTRAIPMTGDEIAAIVAAGGQAGIAREHLIGYASDAAKMGVAFDMAAGDAGTAMATMSNVLGKPIAEMSKLGDAINHLSDNANSKAADIVNVITRAGSDARLLGMTENQTAALSSTFLSMGKAPELAAQAIKGITASFQQLKAGDKAKELAKIGYTTKSFATAMNKDVQGTMLDFIERVKKLPKDMQYGFAADIFGKQYADDIMLMAQNTEEYHRQLKLLQETDENGNPKYIGSMQREFANRSATTANNFILLKNSVVELGIRLGSVLLPALNELVNEIKPVIYAITDWAAANPKLVKGLMAVGTALAAAKVGSLATKFAFNGVKTMGNELFIVANKLSAGWLKHSILLNRTKAAAIFAEGGFKALAHSVWVSSVAFLTSPIALIIAGIAAAGFLIYKFWKPIKAFVSGFFEGIGEAVKPLKPLIDSVNNAFAAIWDFLSPIVTPVINFFKDLFSFEQVAEGGARELGRSFGLYIGNAINAVINFFSSLWDSVVSGFDYVTAAIGRAWDDLSNWFGSIWQNISASVSNGVTNIGNFISNFNPLALFQSVFSGVLSWFGIELPSSFSNFGKNIIDGLVNGIKNAWELAKNTVSELGSGIKNWFAEKLGIHSPSRVFMGFGENTVQGLAIGITQTAALVTGAVSNIGADMQTAMPKTIATPTLDVVNMSMTVAEQAVKQMKPVVVSPVSETVKNTPTKRKKTPQTITSAVQKSVVADIAKPIEPIQPIIQQKEQGFWGNLWDSVRSGFSDFSKSLDFGWEWLKNGTGIDLGLVFNHSENDWRTPSFNPSADHYADYQPLNRNAVTQAETNNNNGIVVNFNPTINVNGNTEQGIVEQVQQGLQMSAYEFEQLLNRVLDQRQRRAY